VQLATRPKFSGADKDRKFVLKTRGGEELRFSDIMQVALWAALHALKP
jgi:hypothetical protein